MILRPIAAAIFLVCAATTASAVTSQDFGSHTLSYDETTSFGFYSSSFTAGGGAAGFSWTVPNSAQVVSFGSTEVAMVALPSFTITANAGWALSDIKGFLGNLVYTELGDGATTGILIYADVSIDGGPAISWSDGVDWAETSSVGVFRTGYFGETFGPATGGFTSITVSNAHIDMSASGGTFSSVTAQPQNILEISLIATAVPEPESYALLLAGLGVLGWLGKRRARQG